MKKQNNIGLTLVRNTWDAAVGLRGNLGPHEILYELPMSTFSIKEREDDSSEEVAEVSGATTTLLRRTEGMVTPLWELAGTWSEARAVGVAVGLPTTVVAGVGEG